MKVVITGDISHFVNKVRQAFLDCGYSVSLFSMMGDEWDEQLIEKGDVVVHVAGVTPKKDMDTNLFYEVNHQKTKKLVSICKEKEISHFVYISTMAVFGNELKKIGDNPICLATECDSPSPYGESKLLAEKEIATFPDSIKYTILRVPSLYDEVRQEYFYVFYNLAKRLPVIPKFTFNTQRTLLCIDTLCKMLTLVVNDKEKFSNRVLLPSDDCKYDVNDLFSKVCKDLGMKKGSIKIGLSLARLLSKRFPFFLSYTLNAYYSDADAFTVPGKTIYDYTIKLEK